MTLPDRNDFLDYVEGAALKNADVQKNILLLLAGSQVYREQCAELRRDLYQIEVKVPEYSITEVMAADLANLAKDWVKLEAARRTSFRSFTKTREFLTLVIVLGAAFVFILAVAMFRLR